MKRIWKSLTSLLHVRMTQEVPIIDYTKWTRRELLERIAKLEGRATELHKAPTKVSAKLEKKPKQFDFSKHSTRFIALKFAYLGWNYNGLAVQKTPTPLPTVEGVILDAMSKCKLIPSLKTSDYRFSRCGRTDRGVSAMNQVISLDIRSNLSEEDQQKPEMDIKEIDYINTLNNLLPPDIKFHAVCLRPPAGFDARFSCESRHYKYVFHKSSLNIPLMSKAASYYEGSHDFRNFCKLDGSKQITNYVRRIIRSEIVAVDEDFFCFDLEGTAFLWHQVRDMIAVLLLVGHGLEKPEVVQDLMDISRYPGKPVYDMASDLPLVLYDCKYPEMEWQSPVPGFNTERTLISTYSSWLEQQLKTKITGFMSDIFYHENNHHDIYVNSENRTRINLGDGKGKVVGRYIPISKREVQDSYEVVNEKWTNKKRKFSE